MSAADREKKLFASARQETMGTTSNLRVPHMTAAVNSEHYDEVMTKSDNFYKVGVCCVCVCGPTGEADMSVRPFSLMTA